jgi:hypothetical protein
VYDIILSADPGQKAPIMMTNKVTVMKHNQVKDHILCQSCEERFNEKGEKYAISLMHFVRGAAIDLAPRSITVNNIQPGPTATDMNSARVDLIKALIPLKRMGDVSEIAGLVAYLASEEAGFITGASLTIDGGYVA